MVEKQLTEGREGLWISKKKKKKKKGAKIREGRGGSLLENSSFLGEWAINSEAWKVLNGWD
jgi:hypothetical protein